MIFLANSANRQVASLTITTLACIFSSTSLGLVEWRFWYTDHPLLSPSGLTCVGMWRVCIYRHDSNSSKSKACYHYSHQDAFLPSSIRVAQHVLLFASALGFLGKAFIINALRKVYQKTFQNDVTCHPFLMSGILNFSASACISVVVIWNYKCILNLETIDFPPSFQVPLKPHTQEVGNAILLATVAAFLLLVSGIFSVSSTFPPDIKVYPDD